MNKNVFVKLFQIYLDFEENVLAPLYEIFKGETTVSRSNEQILDLLIDEMEPYVDQLYFESFIVDYLNKDEVTKEKPLIEHAGTKEYTITNIEELYDALNDIKENGKTYF